MSLTSRPNVKDLKIDNENTSNDLIYAIHAEFDNDFNNIRVYIEDFLNYFHVEERMITIKIKDFKCEILDKILVKLEPISMFHVF